MKRLIFMAAVILTAFPAWGERLPQKGDDQKALRGFAPTLFGSVTVTKASVDLLLSNMYALRIKTASTAVTVQLNGAGTTWPMDANVVEEYHVAPDMTSFVFGHASSAGVTIYWQAEKKQ